MINQDVLLVTKRSLVISRFPNCSLYERIRVCDLCGFVILDLLEGNALEPSIELRKPKDGKGFGKETHHPIGVF